MLLVRREGRQLCLQCHTGFQRSASAARPPGLPDQRRMRSLPRDHPRVEPGSELLAMKDALHETRHAHLRYSQRPS